MKIKGNDRTLESFKIFPYVAWAITIWFAFFVYTITTDLKAVTVELDQKVERLSHQVDSKLDQNTDFE